MTHDENTAMERSYHPTGAELWFLLSLLDDRPAPLFWPMGEPAENWPLVAVRLLDAGLAVRGENAAARQALIGMIRDRSGEMPRSSHTFCVPYAVSAMSAAGRCGMTEALPALLDIVCDPDYACDIPNLDTVDDKTKLLCDDDVKYIYFAAALGALGDIFRLHPDEVRRAVRGREKPDLSRYVTGASMIGRTDGVRNSSEKNMRRVIDEVWG